MSTKSANILATWICIDNKANASWFPAAKGSSSDFSIQANYWRCMIVSLYSARLFNPEIRLALFSNENELPEIDGVGIKKVLKSLNVEFYVTPFEFETPENYYGHWKNQFYEFSIFKYISDSKDFGKDDNFVLIDSDCFISKKLDELFVDINQFSCINYEIRYQEDQKINGNSRNDMKAIFTELDQKSPSKLPSYYGGEFFAAKVASIKLIMAEFDLLWPKLLTLHKQNLPRLHEEAHVLSYIYYKLGYDNNVGNKYVKRLWTDPTSMRNVSKKDVDLALWHLPAQKRDGFKKMFKYLAKSDFEISKMSSVTFTKKARLVFQVPDIDLYHKIFYLIKGIAKKVVKKG